ncbi:lytic transglycosylase, partial [Rhodococcus aetherivorans]
MSSSEPASMVMAIGTAVGVVVSGMDLPQPLEDQARVAVEAVQEAAGTLDRQVADLVAGLPEPMRPAAEQAVADATSAAKDALMPHLPAEAAAVLEPPPAPVENPVQAVLE